MLDRVEEEPDSIEALPDDMGPPGTDPVDPRPHASPAPGRNASVLARLRICCPCSSSSVRHESRD